MGCLGCLETELDERNDWPPTTDFPIQFTCPKQDYKEEKKPEVPTESHRNPRRPEGRKNKEARDARDRRGGIYFLNNSALGVKYTLACAAHGVRSGRITAQPVWNSSPATFPPKQRVCCDLLSGRDICDLHAPGSGSGRTPRHPDIQLVPPSAQGSLQPTGPALATWEATC